MATMNKKILIIGGTGTMGRPLVDQLSNDSSNVLWIVSRHNGKDTANKHILVGNAFDTVFLKECVLCRRYDAIVDFLWYDENRFSKSMPLMLRATDQYILLSSAAVYVESDDIIDENTPRDWDLASEKERIESRDYNFVKARLENMLRESGKNNWTIIRPHLTFNSNRIPLCSWEMNIWLQRVLNGLTVAIPMDLMSYKTTLTHGSEIAHQICKIIGCEKALGETFQLGSEKIYTWKEIVDDISGILKEKGYQLIIYPTDSHTIEKNCPWNANSLIHNRMRNLCFSTEKYHSLTSDTTAFEPVEKYLKDSLEIAIEKFKGRKWGRKDVDVIYEHDKIVGGVTPYSCFTTGGAMLYFLLKIGVPMHIVKNTIHPKQTLKKVITFFSH